LISISTERQIYQLFLVYRVIWIALFLLFLLGCGEESRIPEPSDSQESVIEISPSVTPIPAATVVNARSFIPAACSIQERLRYLSEKGDKGREYKLLSGKDPTLSLSFVKDIYDHIFFCDMTYKSGLEPECDQATVSGEFYYLEDILLPEHQAQIVPERTFSLEEGTLQIVLKTDSEFGNHDGECDKEQRIFEMGEEEKLIMSIGMCGELVVGWVDVEPQQSLLLPGDPGDPYFIPLWGGGEEHLLTLTWKENLSFYIDDELIGSMPMKAGAWESGTVKVRKESLVREMYLSPVAKDYAQVRSDYRYGISKIKLPGICLKSGQHYAGPENGKSLDGSHAICEDGFQSFGGKCTGFRYLGQKREKNINLIFLPMQISDPEEFLGYIKAGLERDGLFSHSPFSEHKDDFNVVYTDFQLSYKEESYDYIQKGYKFDAGTCSYAEDGVVSRHVNRIGYDEELLTRLLAAFPAYDPSTDIVIILFKDDMYFTSTAGTYIRVFIDEDLTETLVHEIGHAFLLEDEYEIARSDDIGYNCGSYDSGAACSGWCKEGDLVGLDDYLSGGGDPGGCLGRMEEQECLTDIGTCEWVDGCIVMQDPRYDVDPRYCEHKHLYLTEEGPCLCTSDCVWLEEQDSFFGTRCIPRLLNERVFPIPTLVEGCRDPGCTGSDCDQLGCYYQCGAWNRARSTFNSIMRNHWEEGSTFNYPSREVIKCSLRARLEAKGKKDLPACKEEYDA